MAPDGLLMPTESALVSFEGTYDLVTVQSVGYLKLAFSSAEVYVFQPWYGLVWADGVVVFCDCVVVCEGLVAALFLALLGLWCWYTTKPVTATAATTRTMSKISTVPNPD